MRYSVIKLSRNYGHQNALMAALRLAPGDAIISIDADLQDDIQAIKSMVTLHHAGNQIVYGVRSDRGTDTTFKRITALAYYQLLRFLGVRIVMNHADFRLMSRVVIEQLRGYQESNLFLRAIIPQLGFNSEIVYYKRLNRICGQSKYPFLKMLKLAIEGITSFSVVPLRLATLMGIMFSGLSFALGIWVFWQYLSDQVIQGWSSTVLPIFMIGGIQLIFLGIVGEYIGKIYIETKARPLFIVEKFLQHNPEN